MDKKRRVDFRESRLAGMKGQPLHKSVHPHIKSYNRLPFLLRIKAHNENKILLQDEKWVEMVQNFMRYLKVRVFSFQHSF